MATNLLNEIIISYQWQDVTKLMCMQGWESPVKENGLYNVLVKSSTQIIGPDHLYQICPFWVVPFVSLPIIHIFKLIDIRITFLL